MPPNPHFLIIDPDAEAAPTVPDYGDIPPDYEQRLSAAKARHHHTPHPAAPATPWPAPGPHGPADETWPDSPHHHREEASPSPGSHHPHPAADTPPPERSDIRPPSADLHSPAQQARPPEALDGASSQVGLSPIADLRFAPTGATHSTLPSTIALSRGCSDLPSEKLARIRALLAAASYRDDTLPPEDPVIMSIDGVPVAHAGNLVCIEGGNKAGKTALYCAGIASTYSDHGDFLGWESDGNPHRRAVVHFDSEQSRSDHDRVIRSARARAGVSTTPPWFSSYCLTAWELTDARIALDVALADAATAHGGIHSIWVDGGADFVASVNDETEALAWVRTLHSLAIHYACPVFVILHLNPAARGFADKSRGHLGSQLDRKAETVIRLIKEDQVTTVYTSFARRAPILKETGPQFTWDPASGMHTTLAIRKPTEAARERQANLEDLADELFLDHHSAFGMTWTELGTRLTAALTFGGNEPSPSTIMRRIRALTKAGLIRKTDEGRYKRVR